MRLLHSKVIKMSTLIDVWTEGSKKKFLKALIIDFVVAQC
jgi:hypothetical protein